MSNENDQLLKVERLLMIFKPERYSYLIICFLSCLILVGLGLFLLAKKEVEAQYVIGMFGSSGVMAVAISRVLKMWNDVMKVLFNVKTEDDGQK